MALDLSRHPCFDDKARHAFGRVHLPVAPRCNMQCNFCDRKFDCANESRPGVTSVVLSPAQALHYLGRVVKADPRISVVGIAGPGDPFANADETMETMRLVRRHYPDMILCLATNGLEVGPYIDEIAQLNVSHVTITVNAVDPAIIAKVYAWIRDGRRPCRGEEAGRLLIDRQLSAIKALKERGVTVKINNILIPSVNDHHVDAVARATAALGADIFNCIPLYPVKDTPFESLGRPPADMVAKARAEAGEHIAQMHHCTRCRADAVGLLGEQTPACALTMLREAAAMPRKVHEDRPCVAVASMEGLLVNQHLGEAERLWIFAPDNTGGFIHIDTRDAPPVGGGTSRWADMARILHDCRAVLVSGAGETPKAVLTNAGVPVVLTECLIHEALEAVYSGKPVQAPARAFRCGSTCSGAGNGCA